MLPGFSRTPPARQGFHASNGDSEPNPKTDLLVSVSELVECCSHLLCRRQHKVRNGTSDAWADCKDVSGCLDAERHRWGAANIPVAGSYDVVPVADACSLNPD